MKRKNNIKTKSKLALRITVFSVFLLCQLLPASNFISPAETASAETDPDYDAYQKYELYLKSEKKDKYDKYKKYKRYKKKYGFSSSAAKAKAKAGYDNYKKYKKNPAQYPGYEKYYPDYKKYSKYKKYVSPYSKYSRYSKYSKYDKDEYDAGSNYGSDYYKDGHDRYLRSQENGGLGEATLGGGTSGPEIAVGLYNYTKNDLQDTTYVRVAANKDYVIKNESGNIISGTAPIAAATTTQVKYLSDGDLNVYQSIPDTNAGSDVYFESADGNNSDMIFDLNRPSSEYDQYRGKVKVHFYDSPQADGDRIWVINTLPLEQYVWGMGEITGTGDEEYNKTMTIMFRTYGYWKIRWSTKYASQGFTVVDTSSDQIYNGYVRESTYPRVKEAAQVTTGKIMMYGDEIALSPYSSWTDGRTRSYQERWGSTAYPWCQSVSDPYGKHATMSTAELEAAGNHMVGLSAHGALSLATDYDYDWTRILNYYFYRVRFVKAY